jgi:hypothetical protein
MDQQPSAFVTSVHYDPPRRSHRESDWLWNMALVLALLAYISIYRSR